MRRKKTQDDVPYLMKLHDGRQLLVQIPARWVSMDRTAGRVFLPDAMRFLDRVRALAMKHPPERPTPGYFVALREALGFRPGQLAEALGVERALVTRWEQGKERPTARVLAKLERLRQRAISQGVVFFAA